MGRSYWAVVLTPENYSITKKKGFKLQGLKSTQKNKVRRIEVGDRMLFYITGLQVFAAVATVTSTFFEDTTKIWTSHDEQEVFPYRVNIESDFVLDEPEYIDAHQIVPRMDFVKKWIPEFWPLACVGDLHIIPKADLFLIEGEMERLYRMNPRKNNSRTKKSAKTL